MIKKKNAARLFYQGKSFYLWQDEHDNWLYTFENITNQVVSIGESVASNE